MRGLDTMKIVRLPALLLLASSVALSSAACGGKQTPDGQSRRAQAAAEAEMTPEERQAAHEQRVEQTAEEALQEYISAGTARERDYRQIEKRLKDVLKERPNDGDVMFNLGLLRYEQNDRAGAEEWWQKATESSPTYARGLANLGMLQLVDGNVDAAEALFQQCVERSQTEPGCNINLALISRNRNLNNGRLTRAEAQPSIDHLRFALGGEARNATAYADLARIYHEMGQLPLARLVCENAILLGIDEAPLHNRLGLVALAEDDVIVAYKEFQRAAELDPDYQDAWMNIGAMALSFRDYEMAHHAFGKVLENEEALSDAVLVDAILSMGVAHRGLDDLAAAEKEYKRVLELQPGDVRALYNLGVLYQEAHRDYKAAVRWFEEFDRAAGQKSEALVADVKQRITTLNALIELLDEPDGSEDS